MTISQSSLLFGKFFIFNIWNHNCIITNNSKTPDTGTSRFWKLSMPILNNTDQQDIKQKLEEFYKEELLSVLKSS